MALPEDEYGKQSLLSVIAGRKFLEHHGKIGGWIDHLYFIKFIEEIYSVNSEHLCRVTGFNMIERTIFVSTKKDILNQQMISYKAGSFSFISRLRVLGCQNRGLGRGSSCFLHTYWVIREGMFFSRSNFNGDLDFWHNQWVCTS